MDISSTRKLVLIAIGTLGDLDPLLAIGSAWRSRGYCVVVRTSENVCDHVRQQGFDVQSICGDLSDITANPLRAFLEIRRSLSRQTSSAAKIAQDASAVLGSGFPYIAPTIAEYCGVPYVYTVVAPTYIPESGLLPYIGIPAPAWVARLGWRYQEFSNSLLFRKILNEFRSELGLKPVGSVFAEVFQPARRILGFPAILSRSVSNLKGVFVSGFLQLPIQGTLPGQVKQFFEDNPAPLVLALGSSRVAKARELTLNVAAAAEKCGLRTLVAGSWSDSEIGELPPAIGRCYAVPYRLLFERAAVVVHHGGAGTFAIALGAGKPQVVLPGFADQSYWAAQASSLGVAPPPISRSKATPQRLLEGIREASSNPRYGRRAEEICGTEIPGNGAAAAAVRWLETFVN